MSNKQRGQQPTGNLWEPVSANQIRVGRWAKLAGMATKLTKLTSCYLLLVVRPGAASSVLAPSSDARSPVRSEHCEVPPCCAHACFLAGGFVLASSVWRGAATELGGLFRVGTTSQPYRGQGGLQPELKRARRALSLTNNNSTNNSTGVLRLAMRIASGKILIVFWDLSVLPPICRPLPPAGVPHSKDRIPWHHRRAALHISGLHF